MREVDGWQLPASYGDAAQEAAAVRETVGICDVTGKTILRVKSKHLRADAPVGSVNLSDDLTIAKLTADEKLVIGSASNVERWQADAADVENRPHVIDLTSGFASFKIAGPKSRDLLAAMTDIDLRERKLPNLTCAQAGFAGVHGTLLHIDIGSTPAYELLVSREFGEYAWHTALESLPSGTVVPIGFEVLNAISGSSK
jgi:heterotetrameric sarcosine oxidase gamma subunit